MPTVAELSVDVEITGVTEAMAELDRLDERLRRLGAETADAHVETNFAEVIAELDDLETKMKEVDAEDIKVPVDIDSGAAEAHIVQLRAALDALTKKIAVGVDVDTGKALAQIQIFRSILLSLQNANVAVDVDIGAGLAHLAALEAALKAIPDETVTVEVDKDRSAWRDLDSLTQVALRASNQVSLLATAILGLGPVAVTAGAVAAGGIGTIGAALTAGTTGVGLFAAAFVTNFHPIKLEYDKIIKAEDEYAKAVTSKDKEDALQKMKEAYQALDPVQRQVLGTIMDFREVWKQVASSIANTQFTMVKEGLQFLIDNLPRTKGVLQGVADVLLDLERNAIRALQGPFWSQFFSDIDRFAATSAKQFLQATGNIIEGLAGVLDAFMPFSISFGDGLVKLTEKFKTWGTTLSQNAGFKAFIQYVQDNLPNVMGLLRSFWDALLAIVEAAAPIGEKLVPALKAVFDFIVKLNDTSPNLLSIALAIGGILGVLLNVLGPLLTFFKTFQELGPVLTALAGPVGIVLGLIALLVGAFILAWQNSETFRRLVTDAWNNIVSLAQQVWPQIVQFLQDFWQRAQDVANWLVTTFGPGFQQVWQFALQEVQKFRDWWASDGQQISTDIQNIFTNVEGAITTLVGAFQLGLLAIQDIWNTVWPGLSTILSGVWTIIEGIVSGGLAQIRALVEIFVGLLAGDWTLVWEGVKKIFTDWVSWLATWGQGLTQIFVGILAVVGAAINSAWTTIWLGVEAQTGISWDNVTTAVTNGFNGLTAIFTNSGAGLIAIWQTQWQLLIPPVTSAFAIIQAAVAGNMSILNTLLAAGVAVLRTIWEAFWSALGPFVTAQLAVIGAIIQAGLTGFQAIFTDTWNAIRTFLNTIWTGIVGDTQGHVTQTGSIIATGLAAIQSGWNAIWNAILTFLITTWSNIVANIGTFIARAEATIATGTQQMLTNWTGIWPRFTAAVTGAIGSIVGAINNMIAQAVAAISGAVGRFVSAGAALVEGFAAGIASRVGSVVSAVASVVGAAAGGLPGSPAEWGPLSGKGYTLLRGQRMMQNFAEGIYDAMPQVEVAMGKSAQLVSGGLPTTGSGIPRISNNSASTVIQVGAGAVQLSVGAGATADAVQGVVATGGDDLARQILMRLQRL